MPRAHRSRWRAAARRREEHFRASRPGFDRHWTKRGSVKQTTQEVCGRCWWLDARRQSNGTHEGRGAQARDPGRSECTSEARCGEDRDRDGGHDRLRQARHSVEVPSYFATTCRRSQCGCRRRPAVLMAAQPAPCTSRFRNNTGRLGRAYANPVTPRVSAPMARVPSSSSDRRSGR